MEGPDRLVLDTQFIDPARNRVRVCTAFLGVDVNFGDGEPILFETVIFGGYCDWQLYRYCTWEEAEQGHAAAGSRRLRKNRRQHRVDGRGGCGRQTAPKFEFTSLLIPKQSTSNLVQHYR